jgi:nucleotide-binding universal stress UspA family protein
MSEQSNAPLMIASVLDEPPPGIVRLIASSGASTDNLRGIDAARDEVEALVDAARKRNVEASGQILQGNPLIEIVRLVRREQHVLLVKTAEPATGVRRVLFGHLDRQLMRNCPCAVWLDKPESAPSYARILAAVDPNPFQEDFERDPSRQELNIQILENAISLAEAEQTQLHVVHAWPFELEGMLQARVGLSPEAISDLAKSIRQRHENALQRLLAPYMAQIAQIDLLKGNPWEVIPQTTIRHSIDLLVMGTVCRTGISGVLLGNTAETVLDQVDCSLLTVKPSGFASPVDVG